MKLVKVIIEGFGSYAKRTVVRLDNPGITLLSGDNGSGKSTIGRAILWALKGTTIEGITKSPAVHIYGCAFCRVDLFYTRRNTKCQVVRLREPGKSGERLEYYINGTKVESARVQETQDRIFKDIGISAEIFGSLFLLSRINAQEFMLSDAGRKQWIEQLFDTDFMEYRKKTTNASTKTRVELSGYHSSFVRSNYEIKTCTDVVKTLEEERERYVANLREGNAAKIASFKEELKEVSRKLVKEMQNLTVSETKRAEQEKLEEKIDAKRTEVQYLTNLLASVYPVADVCLACSVYKEATDERGTREQAVAKAEYALEAMCAERKKSFTSMVSIDFIEQKISSLRAQETALKDGLVRLRTKDTRNETEGFANKIKELREKSLVVFKEAVEEAFSIAVLRRRAEILKFWEEAFGSRGVKNFLMDVLRPILQTVTNSILQKVSPELAVGFPSSLLLKSGETQDTAFPVLLFLDGARIEYKSLSVGQQGRIDFAILFGRRKLLASWKGIRVDFMFLDDFFGSLDFKGISRMLTLVKQEDVPVFVAHPEDDNGVPQVLRDKVDRVIKVKIKNHNTELAEV